MGDKEKKFIDKARRVHGNQYDYSKVSYKNNKTKVIIICPIHGEFEQLPNNHLNGSRCKKCVQESKRKTTDEFVQEANQVHGNKYDYSKVKYENNKDKITIICPIHGEFSQSPISHLKGNGCPLCKNEKIREKLSFTFEDFLTKAHKVHGNKYDYSQIKWGEVDDKKRYPIICRKCGTLFYQTIGNHLSGQRCPQCYGKHLKTTEEFINDAKKVHGDRFDYSKVEYVNSKTKVCIICQEHGEFWQTPNDHLKGKSCSRCQNSFLEREISLMLQENNINFKQHCRFSWLGRQSLDFYLPDYNVAIECQGEQHFIMVEQFGGVEGLLHRQILDDNKLKLCCEHNVFLLYYARKQYTKDVITDKKLLLEKIQSYAT